MTYISKIDFEWEPISDIDESEVMITSSSESENHEERCKKFWDGVCKTQEEVSKWTKWKRHSF